MQSRFLEERYFCVLQDVQSSFGAQPVSCSVGTSGSLGPQLCTHFPVSYAWCYTLRLNFLDLLMLIASVEDYKLGRSSCSLSSKNKRKHIHFQLQNMVTPNLLGKQAWASERLTATQMCEGKLLTLILQSDRCQMVLKGKMYVDSGGVRKAPARMLRAPSASIPQCLYCTLLSSGHALRHLFLCFNFRKHET